MSYSISWLACRSETAADVRRAIGCEATGELGSYPAHPLVGRTLPGGWHVLIANRCDHKLTSHQVLGLTSKISDVTSCNIEEHVMYSASSYWTGGEEVWAVKHQGDDGVSDLRVTGTPPDELQRLRQIATEKQAAEADGRYSVDWFFEVPCELAKQVSGFRHDEQRDDEVKDNVEIPRFEILRIVEGGLLAKLSKPWWRFW